MNRRSFLRTLGLGASVVALSPMLDLAEIVAAPSATIDIAACDALLKEIWLPGIAAMLNEPSVFSRLFKELP